MVSSGTLTLPCTGTSSLRSFATSASVQIMVVTVGAINKQDVNNLYKDSEKTGGERPIDLIVAAGHRKFKHPSDLARFLTSCRNTPYPDVALPSET